MTVEICEMKGCVEPTEKTIRYIRTDIEVCIDHFWEFTGWPGGQPPLTKDERIALRLSGELASALHRIIAAGAGPNVGNDWAEAAMRIHGIQHTIMAQAAARAYPDEFRLLGSSLVEPHPAVDQ